MRGGRIRSEQGTCLFAKSPLKLKSPFTERG